MVLKKKIDSQIKGIDLKILRQTHKYKVNSLILFDKKRKKYQVKQGKSLQQ